MGGKDTIKIKIWKFFLPLGGIFSRTRRNPLHLIPF